MTRSVFPLSESKEDVGLTHSRIAKNYHFASQVVVLLGLFAHNYYTEYGDMFHSITRIKCLHQDLLKGIIVVGILPRQVQIKCFLFSDVIRS
jgi:hypothetical protein